MFRIRDRQLQVFERLERRRFEDDVLVHLRTYFPVDVALLGEEPVRRVIRHGHERAAAHGFTTRGMIVRYIDLGLSLGGHFDRDPLLPWASAALRPSPDEPAEDRMKRLQAEALRYLREAMGPRGEHFTRAMLRAERVLWDELAGVEDAAAREALLARLHPEKMRLLERRDLLSMEVLLDALAARHGLHEPRAKALLCALMFMLGCHVVEDPLYPWVAAALELETSAPGAEQGRTLHEAARLHLQDALTLLRERRRS